MLNLIGAHPLREILCLGAHSDDIEIGCGGTIDRLLQENPGVTVRWVVLAAEDERAAEAQASAKAALSQAARADVVVESFPERFFPYAGDRVKRFFDDLGRRASPDLILTHSLDDRHQDHRLVAELTWNTFRDHLVFEYEIPKYEGDLGHPNVYVALDKDTCERKIAGLLDHFASQHSRYWFTAETFWALLRLRGVEARSPSGYAEAFTGRKVVL